MPSAASGPEGIIASITRAKSAGRRAAICSKDSSGEIGSFDGVLSLPDALA
jgi:hypothetical protein